MDVHVIPALWAEHGRRLRALRTAVFVEEQQVPPDLEWDGADEQAQHFMAIDAAGRCIGCARLLDSGQIGRMAVQADRRGLGIGRRLLDAAVAAAMDRGMTTVFLHAQERAIPFYQRAGFLPEGERFQEAGILHQHMVRQLPLPFEPVDNLQRPDIVQAPQASTPAYGGQSVPFAGEQDALSALAAILLPARREVALYSQAMDPLLFDQPAFVDPLSEFARRSARVQVRLLLHTSTRLLDGPSRLLALARRLDSRIQIRRVPEDYATDEHTTLVVDRQSYWLIPDYRVYQGLANPADPARAERLQERFDYLWDRSQSDPELRVLQI